MYFINYGCDYIQHQLYERARKALIEGYKRCQRCAQKNILVNDNRTLSNDIHVLEKQVLQSDTFSQNISEYAKNTQIQLHSYTVAEPVKKLFYEKILSTYLLSGNKENIRKFFLSIKTIPPLIFYKNIHIALTDKGEYQIQLTFEEKKSGKNKTPST